MSSFFDFFITGSPAAEPPPPDTGWQPTTHRVRRDSQPVPRPVPAGANEAFPVKRPVLQPVRYGDPPHKALAA